MRRRKRAFNVKNMIDKAVQNTLTSHIRVITHE